MEKKTTKCAIRSLFSVNFDKKEREDISLHSVEVMYKILKDGTMIPMSLTIIILLNSSFVASLLRNLNEPVYFIKVKEKGASENKMKILHYLERTVSRVFFDFIILVLNFRIE